MTQDLSPLDFTRLSQLVFESSGIYLKPDKAELLRSRLAKRLRALGLTSFKDYWEVLKADPGSELPRMLDQVCTNKTEFFREERHFQHLAQVALPQFRGGRPLRLWSAACSSGEEAYTLAMVLSEQLGEGADFKIVASDLSEKVLALALAGVYAERSCEGIPAALKHRYFEPLGPRTDRRWRAKDSLRARVSFARFNLVREDLKPGAVRPFDAIFCRNVMIYFDRPTQEAVVQRLASLLVPGGWLYTGLSESLIGIRHSLQPMGPSIYRHGGEGPTA